jgi:hypothetical protein
LRRPRNACRRCARQDRLGAEPDRLCQNKGAPNDRHPDTTIQVSDPASWR